MIDDKDVQRMTGRVIEMLNRPICHTWNWWESVYGAMLCGYCHPPPADQNLVKHGLTE